MFARAKDAQQFAWIVAADDSELDEIELPHFLHSVLHHVVRVDDDEIRRSRGEPSEITARRLPVVSWVGLCAFPDY
ncbi:MAG: hypothetical protein ACAI34_09630 [Verrucomicrobium sp.]